MDNNDINDKLDFNLDNISDNLLELEKKCDDILEELLNINDLGLDKLRELSNNLTDIKSQTNSEFSKLFISMDRDDKGKFIGRNILNEKNFDIDKIADISNLAKKLTDKAYDNVSIIESSIRIKEAMFSERFNSIRKYKNKISQNNYMVNQLKSEIENIKKYLTYEHISPEKKYFLEMELDNKNKFIDTFESSNIGYQNQIDKLKFEMDIIKHGGLLELEKDLEEKNDKKLDEKIEKQEEKQEEKKNQDEKVSKEPKDTSMPKDKDAPIEEKKQTKKINSNIDYVALKESWFLYENAKRIVDMIRNKPDNKKIVTDNAELNKSINRISKQLDIMSKLMYGIKFKEAESSYGITRKELESDVKNILNSNRVLKNDNIKTKVEPEKPKDKKIKNKPIKVKNDPKLTAKTIALSALGIGVGIGTIFGLGIPGIIFVEGGGALIARHIEKKLNEVTEKATIKKIDDSSETTKNSSNEIKSYLKSEEGLRDMLWTVNHARISKVIKNSFSKKHNDTVTNTNLNSDLPNSSDKINNDKTIKDKDESSELLNDSELENILDSVIMGR